MQAGKHYRDVTRQVTECKKAAATTASVEVSK
jgi:hypothetical protein